MDQSIIKYKEKLADIINTFPPNATSITIMRSNLWKELTPLITEDVLLDAHKHTDCVYSIAGMYDNSVSRPCKNLQRILEKKQINRSDSDFKVNSDFLAFRISSSIDNIYECVDRLSHRFTFFFERNSIIDNTTGDLTDIITYCFAYDKRIGYLIEFQIGHPFAMATFENDTYLRDNLPLNPLQVEDVWKDGFYENVKRKILGKNHEFDPISEERKIFKKPLGVEFTHIFEHL